MTIPLTYDDMDDEAIATMADKLAWEMDEYAKQYSLRTMDTKYKLMDRIYSRHIAVLEARGWTGDDLSNRIHCPVW